MLNNQKGTERLPFPANMGEESVFDQVFRNYYAALCDFSQRYLHNKEDAEETVEQLFVNLWNKKPVFSDSDHMRAFLYRSVFNGCMNMLRSNQRQVKRENIYSLDTSFTEESFLHNMLRSETIGMIYREIDSLPDHYSKVIRMAYVDGLKNEEIAAQLNLSVQTVKNYKNKGISLLKTKLPGDLLQILAPLMLAGYLKSEYLEVILRNLKN